MKTVMEREPAGLRDDPPGVGIEEFDRRKLAAGGIVFLAITVGVFWYQFHRVSAGAEVPSLGHLRPGYLLPILLLMPVEPLLAGLRIRLIARVLQPGISYRTCLKAEFVNVAIAILTPSQTGGGPGQIYMLARCGASVGTALTISLLSFMGTVVTLLGIGVFSLLGTGIGRAGPLFAGAVVALTTVAGLILASFAWPGLFRGGIGAVSRLYRRMRGGRYPLLEWRPPGYPEGAPPEDRMGPLAVRLVEIVYTYRNDLGRFLRHGKAAFALACVSTLGFFLSRFLLAFLCIRFLGIDASTPGEIVANQMALTFLIYFAPTPGGAGVAEGASLSIMSGIVSAGYAPWYNLLWRFTSVYLTAAAGMFILAAALVRDVKGRYAGKGSSGRP